ncbi:hypothetical protein [Blautia sp.]|uniref:hypothetical protein n=1 Tax=Blautia sp. TaxID=1955243 RepID=UPI00258F37F7|nr:hypothetical protein [Blautia sp.]
MGRGETPMRASGPLARPGNPLRYLCTIETSYADSRAYQTPPPFQAMRTRPYRRGFFRF